MIKRKLSKDEKLLIKGISELNKRRDTLQQLAVNEIAKNKFQIINFFTSAGKTYLVKNCILRMQKYFLNDNPYVVVVNSDVLKEEFEKVLDGIPNVECYIVNTFVKDRITFGEVNAVFFDEAHHYLNEDSLEFKKTIPKIDCSYKVLLSATLEKEQLNYAESLGFNHNFLVDTDEALFMNLIPDYIIYNLGLELEGFYKTQYENIDKTFKDYVAYFKAVIPERTEFVVANLIKPENKLLLEEVTGLLNEFYEMEYTSGQVMGMVMKYYKSISNRKKFLDSCKIKIDICKKLITKAENLDLQTVVFTGNKLVGKSLLTKNAEVYFSESNLKVIDNFARGITKTIISCNKLVEGQISNGIEFVLRTNYNNKKRYFKQAKGRGLRFSEKVKYLIVVNVYLKNTQEETWLKNQTKNEKFINYISSFEEVQF